MTTICQQPVTISSRTSSPVPSLALNTVLRTPHALNTRYIPFCSPGPQPSPRELETPLSPLTSNPRTTSDSLLHPPDAYTRLSEREAIYVLDSDQLSAALEHQASQPLVDPKLVFPWMHGLHPENNLQSSFFNARRKSHRRSPPTLRCITIVKAGGDLSHSRIKGAVAPHEILDSTHAFSSADPKAGFSVRNFHILTAKLATVSDIVVYGDVNAKREDVRRLASRIAQAQETWRRENKDLRTSPTEYNTFMLQDSFAMLEQKHPDLIAISSERRTTGNILDLVLAERQEMHDMSAPTEIAHNIWLGPSADAALCKAGVKTPSKRAPPHFDMLIEATDGAQMPSDKAFDLLERMMGATFKPSSAVPQLEFPSSGSVLIPTWCQNQADGLLQTCEWLYRQANGQYSEAVASPTRETARKRKDSKVDNMLDDGVITVPSSVAEANPGRHILLHCADGYTETTLLALAYYMYANGVPVHTAYLELHRQHKRNFFSYPSDLALLTFMQPRILQAAQTRISPTSDQICSAAPDWVLKFDGSIPSRITDYMYLGNLGHANNPALLSSLNVGQVLSIGEPVTWTDQESIAFAETPLPTGIEGRLRVLYVDKVQDNGIDSLTAEIDKCLEFIAQGRKSGTATLVHCRVGVSRSATICIAEVMNEYNLSFPRAYCRVRARRLNVIIQPHLRFSYELLKWEEHQARRRREPLKRELEWTHVAREIAALNRPYSRS